MPCRFRCVIHIIFSAGNDTLAGPGRGAGVIGTGGGGGPAEDGGFGRGWWLGARWWRWRRRSAILVSIIVGVVMFGYQALCCICLCRVVCSVENVCCAVEEIIVQEIGGCVAKAWFCGIVEIIRLAV